MQGDPITASQAGIVREVSSEPEEQPQKKAKSTKKKDAAEKAPKEVNCL